MMNTGKPKVKNPQYILHEKSEKENFVLKPYVRKRHHISYQPIKISRKVLEYNPFPIYGPEGVILPPSMEKDSEKLQGKQVKSVKEKLEELADKKRLQTIAAPEQAKRLRLIDSVPCPGQPTIISHRVAGGITEKICTGKL
ncbi:hypothetical protein DSO57_1036870 [Entomophthora muscae]|uniref:Uncharacterized protein n=1 Tax=Entomophthora muscae TaxID=34485 RepID=A0ACC2SNB8_9FUNG|nr:hypothetical protein DSO57_1036870 [Entomophthora muscae]